MQKPGLKIGLLVCFCYLLAGAMAQQVDSIPKKRAHKILFGQKKDLAFPKDFIGHWKGELQWMVSGKPAQKFAMQLIIQPTDTAQTYTWQIIYGENGQDNRPYLLKPVDTAKGHWVVDERDGIVLDSYVHGNAIHGAFTVQGTTIVDNYALDAPNRMRVEFFSIKLSDKTTSGKGTEEVPGVDSYRIASYQTGTLIKLKEKPQAK